jgi:hypothetical protein
LYDTVRNLRQSRVEVAPELNGYQVGPHLCEQRPPPHAGRPDCCSRVERAHAFLGRVASSANDDIGALHPRGEANDRASFRQLRGEILRGMHRYVRPSFDNGTLDLRREQALAIDLGERTLIAISSGGNLQDLDLGLGMRCAEGVDDETGLG